MTRSNELRSAWMADVSWALVLIVLATAGRLACLEWPNLSPVAGLAIGAGWLIRRGSLAVAVPLVSMLISDRLAGGYELPVMLTVYAALTLPVLLGRLGRSLVGSRPVRHASLRVAAAGAIGAASGLIASLLFYLTTNAAFWAFASHEGTTLAQAYVDGLPFLRYTLTGDLITAPIACATAAAIGLLPVSARVTPPVAAGVPNGNGASVE